MTTFYTRQRTRWLKGTRGRWVNKKHSREGVTLIEVIFGVLILATLAAAIVGALRFPRYQAVSSIHRLGAVHLANEVLEAAVSKGYPWLKDQGISTLGVVENYDLHGRDVTITPSKRPWGKGFLVTVEVAYPGGDPPVRVSTIIMPGST